MEKKTLIGLSTAEYIRRADFIPSFLALQKPPNSIMITVHGQSPAKARNLIIEQGIANDCTHILFVDDDMILQPDTLMRLLSHDKDIVSALYLLRSFPHYPALFNEAFESGVCKFMSLDKQEGLVKGVNCGLGCVLIATDVFKKLEKPYVRLGEIEPDGWCDDIGFFNRCRNAGFDIYCDFDATIGHLANVTVWPEKHNNKWMTNYKHQKGNVLMSQIVIE